MNFRVRRHPDVDGDILSIACWLARRDLAVATRFLSAAEDSITSLGHMPGRGSPKYFRNKKLLGVRTWAIQGFRKYLVYYQVRTDHVYVMAVLHGAREFRKALRQRV